MRSETIKKMKKEQKNGKKGIPRKKKHELKIRKGGSCKDKSMKGFHRRMTILIRQSCNQKDISENSRTLTNDSF